MPIGFGNTEGHLFQALTLTTGRYMTAENVNGTTHEKYRQTSDSSFNAQNNQAVKGNGAHNESTVKENGIDKPHVTAAEETASPVNTGALMSPEVPTIARHSKVLRRSSLQNTTAASYMVSDLYRCRTIRRLLDQSSLLQEAQMTLLQDMPTFRPDDFGLDARHHYGSCHSAHGDVMKLPCTGDINYYYTAPGKGKDGKNGDRDKRMAQVIGQSSSYFTIYGVGYFAELLHHTEKQSQSPLCAAPMKIKPYVLKKVNHSLLTPEATAEKPKAIPQAAITLAMEAHFLAASCHHPHIVNLRGMADPGLTPMGQMFFIIDRLEETLNHRIARGWKVRWQQLQRRNSGTHSLVSMLNPTSSMAKKSKAQDHLMQELQFQLERYTAARDLASAIGHLHKHRILHRDIKPENVGFAYPKAESETAEGNREKGKKENYSKPHGLIQLFDFGIATELSPPFNKAACVTLDGEPYNKDETFQMTQRVGSIRYMAPEVYLGKKYGASSDVYSLGVVLFEMFSLQTPFDDMSERSMETLVFERGMRPMDIPSYWSEKLSFLVTTAWSQTLRYRPSAVKITTRLDHLCQEVQEKLLQVMTPPEEPSDSGGWSMPQRRSSLTCAMKKMMPRRMSMEKITRRASISGRAAAGRESSEPKDYDNSNKGKRRSSLKKRGSDASSHGEKTERRTSFQKDSLEKRDSGSSPQSSRNSSPQSSKNRRPFGRRHTMASGAYKNAQFATHTPEPVPIDPEPMDPPSFTRIMQKPQLNKMADHIKHHKEQESEERIISGGKCKSQHQEPQPQQQEQERHRTPTRRRNSMTKYSASLAAQAAAGIEAEEVAAAQAAADFQAEEVAAATAAALAACAGIASKSYNACERFKLGH
jgi:serine/threonine protein kinase